MDYVIALYVCDTHLREKLKRQVDEMIIARPFNYSIQNKYSLLSL